MKATRCLLLVAFAALLVSAQAEIIVWKGPGTLTSGDDTVRTNVPIVMHYILDDATFFGRIVVATPSTKQVFDEGQRSYGGVKIGVEPKETIFFTDAGGMMTNPLDFSHVGARFNGNIKGFIFIGPNNTAPKSLPKTLNGELFETASNASVKKALFAKATVKFNVARTQAANAVGKSADDVADEIIAELITQRGYTEVAAP